MMMMRSEYRNSLFALSVNYLPSVFSAHYGCVFYCFCLFVGMIMVAVFVVTVVVVWGVLITILEVRMSELKYVVVDGRLLFAYTARDDVFGKDIPNKRNK